MTTQIDERREQIARFLIAMLEKKGPVPGANDAERLDYRYLDAGHIDSLGLIRFIMDIEDEFGVTLGPEDTESDEFRTVGGLAGIVAAKLDGQE